MSRSSISIPPAPARVPAPAHTGRAVAFCDGLIDRNPGGIIGVGYHGSIPVLRGARRQIAGYRAYPAAPGNSNNVAEYLAALAALRALYHAGWRGPVEIRTDSLLVANQFSGLWSCAGEALRPLLDRLRTAAGYVEGLEIVWIPREHNRRADDLSRRAYTEAMGAGRRGA